MSGPFDQSNTLILLFSVLFVVAVIWLHDGDRWVI